MHRERVMKKKEFGLHFISPAYNPHIL